MSSLHSNPWWVALLPSLNIMMYALTACPPVPTHDTDALPQQATANRQTIESLIARIERLAESLRAPVLESEDQEHERRETLIR